MLKIESKHREETRRQFDQVHLQKIIQNKEHNLFRPGAFRKNRSFLQNLLHRKIPWVSIVQEFHVILW